LNKYGTSTKVDLPGVGENLQDQPSTAFSYDANITINGAIPYLAYGAISDFLGTLPDVNLEAWATTVSGAINNSVNASSLEQLFQIQYGLFKQDIPDAETIMESSFTLGSDASKLLDISFWLAMPFSRGNVHIQSAKPLVSPQINPNFFLIDFDLTVQVAIAK
jgi:choline dehydrogenase